MLRFALVLAGAALVGCGSTAPLEPTDLGRYETREVQIDPLPDVQPVDKPVDASVDAPSIDVVALDVPAIDATTPPPFDVSRFDSTAGDASPPPVDRVFLEERPVTLCTELAERYATAVRDAQRCAVAEECGARVCETLCCNCSVFVSALGDRVRRLDDMRTLGESMGCMTMLSCSDLRCPAPVAGACSTEGRCVTLREPPRDAGADR